MARIDDATGASAVAWAEPSLEQVRAKLQLPEAAAGWYDTWAAAADPDQPLPLPEAAEIVQILTRRCAADPQDAQAVAQARPDPVRDPELWWVAQRCWRQLVQGMGELDMLLWPQLPAHLGATGRFIYVYACVAAFPEIDRYHRRRGVSQELADTLFADLGEKLRLYREIHGEPGLDVSLWFTTHFRGSIYQLGRLQYTIEPLRLDVPEAAFADAGADEASRHVLGVHIPESGGPMTPQACQESIDEAVRFFPSRFPDFFPADTAPVFVCTSWILDPQLDEVLGEDSNIVQLQRRFTLLPATEDTSTDAAAVEAAKQRGETDVLRFVFQRVGDCDPATLPRDSRLRRALADARADGRGWRVRSGWFRG